jgi:hypothetical protein
MKRLLLTGCFVLAGLLAFGLEPREVEINETAAELEIKRNKFLAIEEADLRQYETVSRQLDREQAIGQNSLPEAMKLRGDFDSFAARRLNMIRKVFVVFRQEFTRVVSFFEAVGPERLPAFSGLVRVLDESLDDAKMKGSKEKWQDLKARARALTTIINTPGVQQAYRDHLTLTADDAAHIVLEAKIRLLHRWLLTGWLDESRPWILDLAARFPDQASCLALQSHYWLEEFKLCMAGLDLKEAIEKKIAQAYPMGAVTVTIKMHGEDFLPKAFLLYVEALRRGYPPDREIPGLLPLYWQYVEVMYRKIHPYFRYPDRFPNYREFMKTLASRCQAIVESVPFRKYAMPAYQILNEIYRYWPEKAGLKIIEFAEIMRLNRLASQKKL